MKISHNTQMIISVKVCDLLNQLIGDVTSKNLFTGYGLYP